MKTRGTLAHPNGTVVSHVSLLGQETQARKNNRPHDQLELEAPDARKRRKANKNRKLNVSPKRWQLRANFLLHGSNILG